MTTAALALDWLEPCTAVVIAPPGAAPRGLPPGAQLLAGEHPLPGTGSFAAGTALLAAAGDLIVIGPTETNVNDLFLVLTTGS